MLGVDAAAVDLHHLRQFGEDVRGRAFVHAHGGDHHRHIIGHGELAERNDVEVALRQAVVGRKRASVEPGPRGRSLLVEARRKTAVRVLGPGDSQELRPREVDLQQLLQRQAARRTVQVS